MSNYKKIVWIAKLATVISPSLALIYSLLLILFALITPYEVPVGSFQGATVLLFPFLLIIAFTGWKWPLLGGILAIVVATPVILPALSAIGWPGWYKIPYLTCWSIYIAGGILYIIVYIFRPGRHV